MRISDWSSDGCSSDLLAGAGILAGAQVALDSDGTITFTGAIQDSTCVVDHTDPHNQTVNLAPVNQTAFSGAGSTTGWQEFEIKLKDCSGTTYNTARAYFESGTTVNTEGRTEARHVGKECVRTFRSRWSPYQ